MLGRSIIGSFRIASGEVDNIVDNCRKGIERAQLENLILSTTFAKTSSASL